MKASELIAAINKAVDALPAGPDGFRVDPLIEFWPEQGQHMAIRGGVMGSREGDGYVLFLADMRLDQVGGF